MYFLTPGLSHPSLQTVTLLLLFDSAGFLLLCGLSSSCRKWGLLSSCGVQASHCGGLSLQSTGSRACGLQSLQLQGFKAKAQ